MCGCNSYCCVPSGSAPLLQDSFAAPDGCYACGNICHASDGSNSIHELGLLLLNTGLAFKAVCP
jgi:hypothetical protein